MLKIDDENVVKVKTRVQGGLKRSLFVYLAQMLFQNGLELKRGQDLELCLDKKNKIVYFRYGEVEP